MPSVEKYSKAVYDLKTNSFRISKVKGKYNLKGPLKVCVQITRKCNLRCSYCSEPEPIKELSLAQIKVLFKRLKAAGVLFLSITGGEPLVRKDFRKIISLAKNLGFGIALDSNAVLIDSDMASFLAKKAVYVNTSLDGGPEKHNKLRGCYSEVISGIKALRSKSIPVIVSTVLLGDCIDDAKQVLKEAESLGVMLVKFLAPIPRGRLSGLKLSSEKKRLDGIWKSLSDFKAAEGLSVSMTLSDWASMGKGSLIIMHPDGNAFGSPAIGEKDCLVPFGNLLEEPVERLWENYAFKESHVRKYAQETVRFKK